MKHWLDYIWLAKHVMCMNCVSNSRSIPPVFSRFAWQNSDPLQCPAQARKLDVVDVMFTLAPESSVTHDWAPLIAGGQWQCKWLFRTVNRINRAPHSLRTVALCHRGLMRLHWMDEYYLNLQATLCGFWELSKDEKKKKKSSHFLPGAVLFCCVEMASEAAVKWENL